MVSISAQRWLKNTESLPPITCPSCSSCSGVWSDDEDDGGAGGCGRSGDGGIRQPPLLADDSGE